MSFDPLRKVHEAGNAGLLPKKVYQAIIDRSHLVSEGIARVEEASGLKYPYYYVEPNLVVSTSEVEFTQLGIFFARTIPAVGEGGLLHIVIQITAPLIAYGLKGTIHAILAHEFMHYIDLVGRSIKMNIISDEISGTLFEERFADSGRLLEAKAVFRSDPMLIRHITTRFPEGFRDYKLEDKVIKDWMDKGLPTTKVPIDANIVKIPIEALAKLRVDQSVKDRIIGYESRKPRKKTIRREMSDVYHGAGNSRPSGADNNNYVQQQ